MLEIFLLSLLGILAILFIYKFTHTKSTINYWSERGVFVVDMDKVTSPLDRLRFKVPFVEIEHKAYKLLKASGQPFGGILQSLTPNLLLIDPDLIKQILIKDFDYFVNRRPSPNPSADPLTSRMLASTNNKPWKDLRSTMTPAFATGSVRRSHAVFKSSSEQLVKHLERKLGSKGHGQGQIDMRDVFVRYTIDTMTSVGWGINCEAFSEEQTEFARMAHRMQNPISENNFLKLFFHVFGQKICSALRIPFNDGKAVKYLVEFTKSALKERQENLKDGDWKRLAAADHDDFLQFMIETKKKLESLGTESDKTPLTDELIVSNTLLFFLANPVGTVLEFATYELALNPDIQEKVYQEILKAVGEDVATDSGLSYERIQQMPYLDKFLSETLRKYPPSIRTERACRRDYKIPNTDIVLKKGTIVTIPIYGIHYDERYYPDPLKFDPERFSNENKSERSPYTFMAFGHGPRGCIAMRFALTLCKSVLAQLLYNFKLEPSKKTNIPIKLAKTNFKVADGMWLNVIKRSVE